jgi:hypothetical protein
MPPHYGKAVPQNELFKRNRNLSGMNSINDNAQSGAGPGNRLLVASGILCAALGTGWMLPLLIGCLAGGAFSPQGYVALAVGLVLAIGGAVIVCCSVFRRRVETAAVPAPIRAVMAANIVFLAFCALETSDGLIYRGGRIIYWTSFLVLPALAVLYGHILAHRWAWWVARLLAGVTALWFIAFIPLLPFANLRGPSGPTPWYGRLYMAGVSLVFAGIAIYVYRSLNESTARQYFRLVREQ